MTGDAFDAFCAALPATTYVEQWGGKHVWKVGGKVFAWADVEAELAVTFKVSPISYDMLRERPGVRPAPYMATRGLLWIQHYGPPGLDDAELQDYLREAHRMAALGLSGKRRAQFGLA